MNEENNALVTEISDDNVDSLGDGLFEGWDDDSMNFTEETETEEVTETEGESAEDEDESESTDQADEEAEDEAEKPDDSEKEEKPVTEDGKTSQKTYTFTHLDDDPITLTPEEMVPYVNKGLDYDRIRSERDAMKANYPKLEMYAEFLNSIKGKFDSVEDLMDDTNAVLLVKNEADNGRTLTKEDALKKVKANREAQYKTKVPPKAAEEKPEEPKENPKEAEAKSFVATFRKVFPKEDVPKWEELPAEVQKEFEETGKLTAPYLAWRLSQKENEIKTIKNNQKNKERSTGSRKTIGKGKAAVDPMLVGFDDDF